MNGNCNTNGTLCVCNSGYTTRYVYTQTNKIIECNYKQKKRITAFLLELFIGYASGAGYFYIGRIGLGIAQTVFFWSTIYISCCISFIIPEDKGVFQLLIIQCFFNIGICIWWIIAFVTMITNKINDGNDIPLF